MGVIDGADQGSGAAHEAMAATLAGTQPRKIGLFGRIMGQKHMQNLREDENKAKFIMDQLHDVATNPNNALPDETVDWLVSQAGSVLGKDMGKAIKDHFEQVRAKKDLERRQGMLPKQQGTGQAPPVMPAAPKQPPGLPTPPGDDAGPFESGVPAGPTPPQQQQTNPVAERIAGAERGTIGFGLPPMPVTPPSQGSMFRKGAVQSGVDVAATEQPGLQMKADLAVQMQQALIGQAKAIGLTDPDMIADYVNKHAVSQITDLGPGHIGYTRAGKQIGVGGPQIHSLAPGANAAVVPTTGGASGTVSNPVPGMPPMPGGSGSAQPNIIQGPPALLGAEQRAANQMWEAKHGKPASPGDFGQAMSEYKEASITTSARDLQKQRIANFGELRQMRQLEQQKLTQSIREFNQTRGPAALDNLATQVYENPDLFQKLTGDVANTVAQRFREKYNLPAPRPLPSDMKNKEDGSIISLNHVAAIKELIKNNPAVQKRMGAWDGRVGNLEQLLGDTTGLSAADSQAIQNLRTRLSYLFAQEGKAVFGGRPPQALMNSLKESSPNMKMGLPLFLGAMDAVQGMGELNIKSTNDYRYNKQAGMPAPPPGGLPAPLPDGGGKAIDVATGRKFYEAAGKDPVKAAQMAKDHHWVVPEVQ